jgi:uncharacterized protein YdeI (YjbR/CyaY-like superfamily)
MSKVSSVEAYIETHQHFNDALSLLRQIINNTELNETIKWNAPVYELNGKNVVGLVAFKQHFGIWFFNGVFLKDELKLLVNAQEGKTKALRQMRFESINDINKNAVLAYVKEAIENQKAGKELKPDRSKKKTVIPLELQAELNKDKKYLSSFKALSPSKQREYCEHIATAKKELTKLNRLKNIKPMIIQGASLHDKYKNS